ncbi:MAG: hypothetical protein IT178_09545 [Acidobacteria bacterium]|nr:hypothetical protein [Acidobacteriota bacterium]
MHTTVLRTLRAASLFAAIFLATGCGDDDAVTTPTSPTQTAADASIVDTFEGRLPVGTESFYSFTVNEYGTVTVQFESIGGSFVPSTLMMGIGLGQPAGTDCVTTTTLNTAPGTAPQVTGVYEAGVYCAKIWDLGNLYAPADFRLLIAHP